MEKTEWFPGDVVPEYPGLYERRYSDRVVMDFWTGEDWMYQCVGHVYFDDWGLPPTMFESSMGARHFPWRGVVPYKTF